jgi:hypothetical protein
MAVYKCNGELIRAKNVNSAIEGKEVKEIKTVWSGKLSDLVTALVGEFESISIYGRLGGYRLDEFTYGYELIEEGLAIIKAIRRNLERAEELLQTLKLAIDTHGHPETGSVSFALKIDDREV